MTVFSQLLESLRTVPNLACKTDEALASYTRFGIGGPARLFCDTASQTAFTAALQLVRQSGLSSLVIGGGTNLVVSDTGFDGVVLRFTGAALKHDGLRLFVEAGAPLQTVVDASIAQGLSGIHSMIGIPGYLGGAVYGNAGAYGHSMQEVVEHVAFTDGNAIHELDHAGCEFHYRESRFKHRKDWVILAASLRFVAGDTLAMRDEADKIRAIRDEKYPPSMKCAGSIFKNLFFAALPPHVQAEVPPKLIREGKVPSAWFLEQAGVRGRRRGDIQVADYHANLIYNDGCGTSADLVAIIDDCKASVRQRFGFDLEEEVQYVGFTPVAA